MEIYNGKICVTVAELTDDSDGMQIMSMAAYKSLTRPDRRRLIIVRPGKGLDSYALIDWQTLPERFKEKYIIKYGNPEDKIREERMKLEYNQEARTFFAEFLLPDGSALKSDVQSEYVINASVLDRLIERLVVQKISRNKACNTTPISWDGIMTECEVLRSEYGHTLPKSTARLRDKIRQYQKDGYECLISGKLTNRNAIKITKEGGKYIVAMKRSRVRVYTNQQIFEEYNAIAPSKGWKTLKSPSSLVQYLERPEVKIQWVDAVFGELKAKQMYSRQNVTVMPTCRDAIWYGDGTKLNLFYKVYTKDGYKPATAQVFEVIDAYSECLLGYHISNAENFESMYEAYRMSVELTQRLPVELIYDNQGGTKMDIAREWLQKIATCSRPTAPYNAASKSIESLFGRFQSQVLHKRFGFSGQNITAKSDKSRANMEFILANVNSLPTYEQMVEIYTEARQEWNRMPHPKYARPRIDLYNDSVNDIATELNDVILRDLFWINTPKPSRFTARGITISVNREKYTYEVLDKDGLPDMEWRSRNTGREFHVQYDPHDMTKVRLCTKDQYGYQFVTEAQPYIQIHRAMMDQEEGERSLIYKMFDLNKQERVRRHIDGLALDMEHGTAPEQHGMISPKPKGITDREYEEFADKIRQEQNSPATVPAEILPNTIGQMEKMQSNMVFDEYSAYDRM